MMTRGKITVAGLACAAAVAGAVLLWPTADAAPKPPTSDQIKASAQAALDASLLEGRKSQLAIVNAGQAPSNDLCQGLWDRKTKAEQHRLLYAEWLHGCADAPGN